MTSPLARHIAGLIQEAGPISLSHYMALALGHPRYGYYMTRDPLGVAGDFTTAPEISQMFGELIGLWLADCWLKQGRPAPFVLAELGPGRGTLMSDIWRATKAVPDMHESCAVHFVETSPTLRAAQAALMPQATWHHSIESLPARPLFIVANEFFDALPVSQYQRTQAGWCECHVALAEGATLDEPRFTPVLAPMPIASDALLAPSLRQAPIGAIAEVSPAARAITEEIANRLAGQGGAALIIDYGHVQSAAGDTFQALCGHQFVDPYEAPGEADLTVHVDFQALAEAAARGGAVVHGPVEQGAFLMELGIEMRARTLKAKATPDQAADIDAALTRLTDRQEMGSLFKVLGLTPRGVATPPGL